MVGLWLSLGYRQGLKWLRIGYFKGSGGGEKDETSARNSRDNNCDSEGKENDGHVIRSRPIVSFSRRLVTHTHAPA